MGNKHFSDVIDINFLNPFKMDPFVLHITINNNNGNNNNNNNNNNRVVRFNAGCFELVLWNAVVVRSSVGEELPASMCGIGDNPP